MSKLKLEVENVGIFANKEIFEFDKGLNVVKAPNATGKTSLINALELFTMDDPDLKNKGFLMNLFTGAHDTIEISLTNQNIDWNKRFRRAGNDLYSFEGNVSLEAGNKAQLTSFATPDNDLINQILRGKPIRTFIENISDSNLFDVITSSLDKMKKNYLRQHQIFRDDLTQLEMTQDRLLKSRNEIAELEKELETVPQVDETDALADQQMRNKYHEKIGEKRAIDDKLRKKKGNFDSLEDQIKALAEQIKTKQELVDEIKADYPLIEKEIEKVVKSTNNTNQELKALETENTKCQAAIKSANDNWVKIKRHGDLAPGGTQCYACGKTLSLKDLQDWQRKNEKASSDLGNKIVQKTREIEDLGRKKTELEKSQRQLSIVETDLRKTTSTLQNRELDKNKLRTEIAELEQEQTKYEAEIEKLFQFSEKATFETWQKREKLINNIEILKQRTISDEENIEALRGKTKDADALTKRIRFIEGLISHLAIRKDELIDSVCKRFERRANEIYEELQFKDFKDIELKTDGRISITRIKAGKIIDKWPFEALSTSERITLALIVLVAAKEEFVPTFPFFVIDEVITSYDPSRFEIIKNYIKDVTEYVIVTGLSDMAEEGIQIVSES
ncbi:MAG TPA: AAA family ATPase [Candidatus Deferrimicrobium sp.]|nr:AAA family ATPase [Candidatus Deferrimicrobium sp.]